MPKHYHHLTYEQRCQIEALLARKLSFRTIAQQLGVHHTTISREISRNISPNGYCLRVAHNKSYGRKRRARSIPKKMTPELVNKIKQNLEEKWSPEQIVGRCPEYNISHTTIYTMIHKDQKLRKNLRHGGKKYRRLSAKTAGAGLIPGRVDIDKRPKIVDKKIRIGDWEADTIIGKNHEGAIFSCVERKTKYTKLVVMPDNKSSSVLSAIKQSMLAIKNKVLTITYDNGKEFVCHKTVNKILKSRSYFAKPYHSWQRGLNEHTNGLVRQYLPKGTSFANLTQEEVQWIEDQLNHRPRKSLNFQTPHEAFFSTRTPVVHLKL